jgi:predicted dehydrogenase
VKRKIAIVGAGYMASEHARAFASLPGIEIAGVVGRTRTRAEALAAAHSTKVYDGIGAIWTAERPDAVVVTVNELSMREVATACFAHPWVSLLEKPAGVDLADAEAILAEADRTGARAYVALNRRSYAATRRALAELEADPGPRLISLLDQQDLAAARAMGQPERVVQNWMYANSIHVIDYLHVFGRGDVVAVEPVVPWTPRSPGHVVAAVKFSSGDTGVYQAVWDGPGPWSATVTNRTVRLEMRPLERLGIQRPGERALTEVPADPIDRDFKPGLRYQAEQILGILGGAATTLPTLAEAARTMRLCADIYGLRLGRGPG